MEDNAYNDIKRLKVIMEENGDDIEDTVEEESRQDEGAASAF